MRCVDGFLWLGCDEGYSLERLTLSSNEASEHKTFRLLDYLFLPNDDEEVDIEGIAYGGYYLWVLGSHSIKRKRPKSDKSPQENLERIESLEREDNRCLLGRIPLVNGQLFRQCSHPEKPDTLLTAAQIKRKKRGNQLTHILSDDPHIGPYLKASIPGKENGLDFEGIAVAEGRLFLGLRGPVLRGWALLIEIFLQADGPDQLKLDKSKGCYRKYFLDLRGHGIRDLCFVGSDLLLLAGPTMDLEGLASIYRLRDALINLDGHWLSPEPVVDLLDRYQSEKAEGISQLHHDSDELVVVYDSPNDNRIQGNCVLADILTIPPT